MYYLDVAIMYRTYERFHGRFYFEKKQLCGEVVFPSVDAKLSKFIDGRTPDYLKDNGGLLCGKYLFIRDYNLRPSDYVCDILIEVEDEDYPYLQLLSGSLNP